MVDKGVHRAWIVDDARRPTGCVAMSDALAVFAAASPGPSPNDAAA